jgi:hypothetical protein
VTTQKVLKLTIRRYGGHVSVGLERRSETRRTGISDLGEQWSKNVLCALSVISG